MLTRVYALAISATKFVAFTAKVLVWMKKKRKTEINFELIERAMF